MADGWQASRASCERTHQRVAALTARLEGPERGADASEQQRPQSRAVVASRRGGAAAASAEPQPATLSEWRRLAHATAAEAAQLRGELGEAVAARDAAERRAADAAAAAEDAAAACAAMSELAELGPPSAGGSERRGHGWARGQERLQARVRLERKRWVWSTWSRHAARARGYRVQHGSLFRGRALATGVDRVVAYKNQREQEGTWGQRAQRDSAEGLGSPSRWASRPEGDWRPYGAKDRSEEAEWKGSPESGRGSGGSPISPGGEGREHWLSDSPLSVPLHAALPPQTAQPPVPRGASPPLVQAPAAAAPPAAAQPKVLDGKTWVRSLLDQPPREAERALAVRRVELVEHAEGLDARAQLHLAAVRRRLNSSLSPPP